HLDPGPAAVSLLECGGPHGRNTASARRMSGPGCDGRTERRRGVHTSVYDAGKRHPRLDHQVERKPQTLPGPRPPLKPSNASPHIFTEFLAHDARARKDPRRLDAPRSAPPYAVRWTWLPVTARTSASVVAINRDDARPTRQQIRLAVADTGDHKLRCWAAVVWATSAVRPLARSC